MHLYISYHYPYKHDPNLYVAGNFPVLDFGWNMKDPMTSVGTRRIQYQRFQTLTCIAMKIGQL